MKLTTLKFSGTFQVTFSAPLTERQVVDLDIKNDWDKAIIFKMKTTRPEAFKMKPVYGLVDAGEKVCATFSYKFKSAKISQN